MLRNDAEAEDALQDAYLAAYQSLANFRGEASLAFDHTARQCTIEGRGIDGRGASRALASGVVKVTGDEVTELAVDGSFTVSGPLETFANAGGVHVARALLAEFSANIAKQVGTVEIAPAPPAAEIGGFGLLWRAFLSWVRGK